MKLVPAPKEKPRRRADGAPVEIQTEVAEEDASPPDGAAETWHRALLASKRKACFYEKNNLHSSPSVPSSGFGATTFSSRFTDVSKLLAQQTANRLWPLDHFPQNALSLPTSPQSA